MSDSAVRTKTLHTTIKLKTPKRPRTHVMNRNVRRRIEPSTYLNPVTYLDTPDTFLITNFNILVDTIQLTITINQCDFRDSTNPTPELSYEVKTYHRMTLNESNEIIDDSLVVHTFWRLFANEVFRF